MALWAPWACAKIEMRRRTGRSSSEGVLVPLSEHEQRVLEELERSLARHDPRFVARVHRGSRAVALQRARWWLLGVLAGVLLMVGTFAVSPFLGLLGAILTFGSALGALGALRRSPGEQRPTVSQHPEAGGPRSS